jgi:putative ABC transport system permease protein
VIILIFISSLLAYPIAWYSAKVWLEGFSEKISVSPLIYIISSLIGLSIGWLSIIYQAFKAAGYSPAQALRYK